MEIQREPEPCSPCFYCSKFNRFRTGYSESSSTALARLPRNKALTTCPIYNISIKKKTILNLTAGHSAPDSGVLNRRLRGRRRRRFLGAARRILAPRLVVIGRRRVRLRRRGPVLGRVIRHRLLAVRGVRLTAVVNRVRVRHGAVPQMVDAAQVLERADHDGGDGRARFEVLLLRNAGRNSVEKCATRLPFTWLLGPLRMCRRDRRRPVACHVVIARKKDRGTSVVGALSLSLPCDRSERYIYIIYK